MEKFQAGQSVTLKWRSFGLGQNNPVALIDTGSTAGAGLWLPDKFYGSNYGASSFATVVNLSGVSSPGPKSVYQNVAYAPGGVGGTLSYNLPVPDGTYTIRLHFVEDSQTAVNRRVFDIKLQNATVQSNFDIFAAAGGQYKAVTRTYTVVASGGLGIKLDLVTDASAANQVASIAGIELTQPSASGVAIPTVNLSVSSNGGATWTAITGASALTMDAYGQGSFSWAIPAGQTPGSYLLKVASNQVPAVQDASDGTFQIANAGHSFYINDGFTAGDQYTSAIGNDANDGKSASSPMATLSALIAAYHPTTGDTIYVDTGAYALGSNLVLPSADSGVSIVGATTNASTSAVYTTQIMSDGPLAYYRFGDAGGTAADASGSGLNGTFTGGVTKGTTGVLPADPDTAITLNGTSGKVSLPSGFADFTNGFSWEGWVYPTTNVDGQAFFDLGNGQANNNIWFGRWYSNNLILQVYHGASPTNIYATGTIEQNKWQHFAVTIDAAGNAAIFKNGVQLSTGNVGVPTNITRTSNFIGKDNWAANPYFGGNPG